MHLLQMLLTQRGRDEEYDDESEGEELYETDGEEGDGEELELLNAREFYEAERECGARGAPARGY
jgi:hypothetical protein